ncbi:type IV pilus twitching motility protein PilT [Geothrix sp. 21YS21S-4]|uniref:type IV pilus twitching motility protein PilT n=1 Tax=Geothrix sp. 21YS21S-4 TaxID=3068889 RepID=UPI0027BA5EE6|nr:PilT/PilU family type 4a pilus ATPase [Geothrix sp. 21YS21S-4]
MAQLDKLLQYVVPRGGKRLLLEPDRPPVLELASGDRTHLLSNPLPGVMVEVLASDIVPSHQKNAWQSGQGVSFDYRLGEQLFRIQCLKEQGTSRILVEPTGAAPASSAPLPEARASMDSVAPPRPPEPAAPAPEPAVPEPRPIPVSASAPAPMGERPPHPLATQLFRALLEARGSDLHCSSYETPLVRVDGDLQDLPGDFGVLGGGQLLELMEAVAPPDAWRGFRDRSDADFAYAFEEGGCRLRMNFFMDRVGPGFVCRVIPDKLPDADQLGLPEHLRRLAGLAKGLVLVTGPTGSGKSTTLAAILDLANQKRKDHILTIEDPIEFVHPRKGCLVNQREVGTHTDSFKSGLRAALREDPDIVMVGEMRDLETIAIALETAITGHLVFGTLHTSSAIGTIDRIVDQFPADRQQQIRVMLADALKCVVSQTLLKKVGGGRIAALETLFISPAIANLIREGKNFQIPSAMQTGRSYGQRLMNDALVELIKDRKVEPMEAYLKCPDKESFIAACKRAAIPFDLRLGDLEN